jgi:sulfoquinovose isomerase
MTNWLDSAGHRHWLEHHAHQLRDFSRRTGRPGGGAYWLGDDGSPDLSYPVHTWITGRMVHVFGLGTLLGVPGSAPVAEQALRGLIGPLRDQVHGGWFTAVDAVTGEPLPSQKACYDHAFVLLAAATAGHAGLPGAQELLSEAAEVFLDRFWDDEAGLCVDLWDREFTAIDDYRGLNANMHAVEAMLSVAGRTGDDAWLERARRVTGFVVDQASTHDWRIPEHFDAGWQPLPEYNRDQPGHQFKPYGATVGHALEWARLMLHLEASGLPDTEYLADAAVALFARAVRDGWARDGHPGFVYTTDWDGEPVVRDRMHWVLCEAINTAAALHRRTGEEAYARWYAQWWDHADLHHIDHEQGSWIAQLGPANERTDSIWTGKADTYHAFQATLVPRLPLYPMVAAAIDDGRLL